MIRSRAKRHRRPRRGSPRSAAHDRHEEQLRVVVRILARQATDHAVSGATLLRSGFQTLMRDALNQRFDVVLAEALDRFSGDQEDTAGLFKRLTFAGVNIVTLAEGDITHLHVGLKGTMNALFLKDLADKTRRGLRGRVELGKSGGGLCYGYKVTHARHDGAAVTGDHEIVPPEAEVIRRIFRDYARMCLPRHWRSD
jgi:site-specific DNA recombinase